MLPTNLRTSADVDGQSNGSGPDTSNYFRLTPTLFGAPSCQEFLGVFHCEIKVNQTQHIRYYIQYNTI